MLSAHRGRILNVSCVLRVCQEEKKRKKQRMEEGGGVGGVSAVIFIGTKFATFSYETEALSWN